MLRTLRLGAIVRICGLVTMCVLASENNSLYPSRICLWVLRYNFILYQSGQRFVKYFEANGNFYGHGTLVLNNFSCD